MVQGYTIGRLAGVEIKLNPSLILIGFLIAYFLIQIILPASEPHASVLYYGIGGVIGTVLFLGAILWHEMAHVMVALSYHIPVVGVTLHIFGGLAQISRDPERPVQEFWIAIAGPLASFSLVIIFGLASGLKGLPGALCGWLASVNLTLALFNLLPGFPLDGGRILRAILWRISGSYKVATRQASRVGQGMAGIFAAAGLWFMLKGNGFNGVWLLLIAFFIYSAAALSYRMAASSAPLPMETSVRRVMRHNVPVIAPDLPLALLAWRYLDHARDQAFPVMEGDSLVGMITAAETDKIPRLEWGKTRVAQVMLPREKLIIVAPDDDIEMALKAFDNAGLDHAPVFDLDSFMGMLNRRDIVYRT